MRKMRYLFLAMVLLMVISSCSKPTEIISETQIPTAGQTAQYPSPSDGITDIPAYPYPEPGSVTNPSPTSTSDHSMGNVIGILLLTNSPVKNVTLDLAEVLKTENGQDLIAGLDRVNSPNTMTDEQGSFAFINVKAGRYALILDGITNQFLLNYPGKKDAIIVQVEPGKVVDLGEINFDTLPLP